MGKPATERWKLTEFQTDLAQRLVDESSLALREWSPLTCRPQTLQTWGETLRRPQRDGEIDSRLPRSAADVPQRASGTKRLGA